MSSPEDMAARIAEATAVFDKDVGVWDAELVITPGPGMGPIPQKGTMTGRRIGDGRWLILDYETESGFSGHGVYGWDPSTGKYTGAWVDSVATSIARSQGTWDAATRTMTLETETQHQGQLVRYREITQARDDGAQLYRNLVPLPDGSELEMIRATYRRRG